MPHPTRTRLHRHLWAVVRALEAGIAAGLAWWIAGLVLATEPPLYAPAAAVAVIGYGFRRRGRRVTALLLGITIGIVTSQVGVGLFGTGTLQLTLFTAFAIVVAHLIADDYLAISYAAFNTVILTTLGSRTWVPDRLLEAVIGAATAYTIVYLVFPPRPVVAIATALQGQLELACAQLAAAAAALRFADGDAAAAAERKSQRIDARADAIAADFTFAAEVSRWSPWRWPRRRRAERLRQLGDTLQEVARDTTTVVRTAARLATVAPHPHADLADLLDRQRTLLQRLADVLGEWPRAEPATGTLTVLRDDVAAVRERARAVRGPQRSEALRTAVAVGVEIVADHLGPWLDPERLAPAAGGATA